MLNRFGLSSFSTQMLTFSPSSMIWDTEPNVTAGKEMHHLQSNRLDFITWDEWCMFSDKQLASYPTTKIFLSYVFELFITKIY